MLQCSCSAVAANPNTVRLDYDAAIGLSQNWSSSSACVGVKLDQCHGSCVHCDLQDALWGLMAAFTRTFDCCLAAIQVASLVDKSVLRIPSLHSIYIQGGGEGHMTMAPVGVTQFKVKAVQAVVCRHRWWLPILLLARGREDQIEIQQRCF